MTTYNGTDSNDTINANADSDSIYGNAGDDYLSSNTYDSVYLNGGVGNDTLDGSASSKSILYDDIGGNDSLIGGAGNDDIISFLGNDTIIAGSGDDIIFDISDNSTVDAGEGNDTVYVSLVNAYHTITGGTGQDTYMPHWIEGQLTITDFQTGLNGDRVNIRYLLDYGASYYTQGNPFNSSLGYARLVQDGANTLLQWDNDGASDSYYTWATLIQFNNTRVESFTADNFLPAVTIDGQEMQGLILTGSGILYGTTSNDNLTATDNNPNNLYGFGGNDTLVGGNNYNYLNGGTGDDNLIGGIASNNLDGGSGNDTLNTANSTQGNTLDGGDGADNIIGGLGADYIRDFSNNTTINAGAGDDIIKIYGDNNSVDAGAGNDTIIEATYYGSDTLTGGSGQDTYQLKEVSQELVIITDFASGKKGDILDISDLLNNLTYDYTSGNPFDKQLGFFTLKQSGLDTLVRWDYDGVLGNNTWSNNNWQTIVVLQNVQARSLTADNFVHDSIHIKPSIFTHTVITGTANNDNLLGTEDNDSITGLAGNDLLNGDIGNDTLIGGLGNDMYLVDSPKDHVIELEKQGTDIIYSSVSYNLPTNVESLSLTGYAAINAMGNRLANIITGNSGNNILDGGAASDTLTGGLGQDVFSISNLSKDTIRDFSVVDDTIQLKASVFTALTTANLSADNFIISTAAADNNDYLIYNNKTGLLSYDSDGSGTAPVVIIALLGSHLALTHADFVVS